MAEPKKPSRRNLYIAVCVSNMAVFASGNCFTWTSPTLPKLESDVNFKLGDNDPAWIGSLITLGAAMGPLIGGFLINRIGPKHVINISAILDIISWIVLLLASSVYEIFIARFLAGLGLGLAIAAISLFVAEVADDNVRPAVGSLLSLFFNLGFMVEYCFGPYVSYTSLIIISMISPISFLLMFTFIPESPYHLLQKNDRSKALKSLLWFRRGKATEEVEKELNTIQAAIEEDLKNKGSLMDIVATQGNRMALFLAIGVVSFQQLSGINVILFYTQTIFDMTGASFSSSISTIIIGAALNVAAVSAPPLTKIFGMKWLFIVSAMGMMIFQGIMGLYFYLLHIGQDMSQLDWLPVFVLMGFIAVYGTGFGALAQVVVAQVFPTNIKASAIGLATSWVWFMAFLITRYFDTVSENMGSYSSFWLFSGFCFVGLLFIIFFLPDTRGMSLQEIQDVLNKRSRP